MHTKQIKINTDVSICICMDKVFEMLLQKVEDITGNDVFIDDRGGKLYITFKTNEEYALIDMSNYLNSLVENLAVGIAARHVDFDFNFDEDEIYLDDYNLVIDGTESHYGSISVYPATHDSPEETSINNEKIQFNEKRYLKRTECDLKSLSIEKIRSFFSNGFISCKSWIYRKYDAKQNSFIEKEQFVSSQAYEVAKNTVDALSFTDEELKKAFGDIHCECRISDEYDYELN